MSTSKKSPGAKPPRARVKGQAGLTPAEEAFAQAYAANGCNGAAAYLEAHPRARPSTAKVEASKTLTKPNVAARIAAIAADREKRLGIDGDEMLRHAWAIATADARQIVQYVYRCCRFCHGKGQQYQRTAAELRRDRGKHEQAEAVREARALAAGQDYTRHLFDEEGGGGFNEWLDPAADCPNCHGRGVGRIEIADTRLLPEPARTLFAGVEETKDGIRVRMHDKLTALDRLFRHKGLYEADNQQLAAATSPEALDALARAMTEARAKQLAALTGRRAAGFMGD